MIQFINIHISARKLHNPSIFSAYILHFLHTYTFDDPNLLFPGWKSTRSYQVVDYDLFKGMLSALGALAVWIWELLFNRWAEKLMKLWHLAQG